MHSLNILNHLTHQAGEERVFLIAVYAWCIRCLEIHFKLYGHTFVTMKYYEEKKHISSYVTSQLYAEVLRITCPAKSKLEQS